jgi:hypothetical protein
LKRRWRFSFVDFVKLPSHQDTGAFAYSWCLGFLVFIIAAHAALYYYRAYAVVGFGEVKPPQVFPFWLTVAAKPPQ